MYNLIECSDSYFDTSGRLWSFKRDEIANNANMTNDNDASSFKYKASFINDAAKDGKIDGVKIAVSLKYLSNFWRSLEMPLVNCKVQLPLSWIDNCVLTAAATGANFNTTGAHSATLITTEAKFYVPVVTLSTKDNEKLKKQFSEWFERSVYWNKYKVIPKKNEAGTNYNPKRMNNCLILFIKELSKIVSGWLAHLVSRFACNTRMIFDASSSPPVSHVK